ncbi:hypothetical protein D3C80_252520 [compost metagenome]
MGEGHFVDFASAADFQLEPDRQRVHNRNAHAMQTTGNLIGILVELTAGMKLSHDDFGSRNTFFLMDIGRDATTVIGHGAGAVGVKRHGYKRSVACKRLIDCIVHDFVDHVMQAGAVIRVTDIHARALTNCVQTFQHTNGIRAIFGGGFGIHLWSLAHENLSKMRRERGPKACCDCSIKNHVESHDKHGFNIGVKGNFSKFWGQICRGFCSFGNLYRIGLAWVLWNRHN